MAWQIRQDFHLDVGASFGAVLVVSGDNSALRYQAPDVVSGDKMPVRFYFWSRGEADVLEVADPGSGASLRFSGRPATVPPGSDLLFLADTFTEISAGVWEGEVDLNTDELIRHLESVPPGAKPIVAEVEVSDDTGGRKSLQFPMVVRPEVYEGQDAPTSLPNPEEWLVGQLLARNIQPARAAVGSLYPPSLTVDGEILGDDGNPIALAPLGGINILGDSVTGTAEWGGALPDTGSLTLARQGSVWALTYSGPATASDVVLTSLFTDKSDPTGLVLTGSGNTVTITNTAGLKAPQVGDIGYVTDAGIFYLWDGDGWGRLDKNALQLTGNQTVAGNKTFTGVVRGSGQSSPPATGDEFITPDSGYAVPAAAPAATVPNYADDAAADADGTLVSGSFYTTTAGGRTMFVKP